MPAQYIIGIDLGTTNSALAYAAIADETAQVHPMPIEQLVNPGEAQMEGLLPSFLYVPGANEFPEGTLALPWNDSPQLIAGLLARKRGVENAGRLVSSAKSWLSHAGVDRTAPILPVAAPEGEIGRAHV